MSVQLSVKLHFLTSCLTASNHVILWVNIAAARIYVSVRVATPGACQTITLVHQSAMMSSDLVHLVSPWQTCSCGWLLAPPSLWFLFSSLSQNITGHNNQQQQQHCRQPQFLFQREVSQVEGWHEQDCVQRSINKCGSGQELFCVWWLWKCFSLQRTNWTFSDGLQGAEKIKGKQQILLLSHLSWFLF